MIYCSFAVDTGGLLRESAVSCHSCILSRVRLAVFTEESEFNCHIHPCHNVISLMTCRRRRACAWEVVGRWCMCVSMPTRCHCSRASTSSVLRRWAMRQFNRDRKLFVAGTCTRHRRNQHRREIRRTDRRLQTIQYAGGVPQGETGGVIVIYPPVSVCSDYLKTVRDCFYPNLSKVLPRDYQGLAPPQSFP